MKIYYSLFVVLGFLTSMRLCSCNKIVEPEDPEPKIEIYIGYAVGDSGKIYRSINGGNTWTSLQSGTTTKLNSVLTINENVAVAVGNNGLILKTTDGGINWNTQPSGTSANLTKIKFNYLMSQIWITGEEGVLLVSNGY